MHSLPPLVALSHNGAPLTHDHGRPIRAIVPGLYGYKSVKYLQEIVLSSESEPAGQFESMFEAHPDQPIAGGTKIRRPLDTAWMSPGEIQVVGYSIPGQIPTRSVELQFNGGPWQPARLIPLESLLRNTSCQELLQFSARPPHGYPFSGVWAPWRHTWTAPPGHHVIRARSNAMPDWGNNRNRPKAGSPWIDEIEVQVG